VFSAGASHYGVADLELLAQDTHKFESRYLDQLIGPYPADKQTYVERSPIHSLKKFTAPIAFFQASLVLFAVRLLQIIDDVKPIVRELLICAFHVHQH
jgi:hypothetical protein